MFTVKKLGQILKKPNVEKTNSFYLVDVQNEVKRLEDRAMSLKNKAIVRTDRTVEEVRLEVGIIKISTQDTKRMMVDELCPFMNETRNLIEETRLTIDVYAKATRSNTRANEIGIRNQRSTFDIRFKYEPLRMG